MIEPMVQSNFDQVKAMLAYKGFLASDKSVFILRGSAGTGKTTLLKKMITGLDKQKRIVQLCAPTNRAAMIVSAKAEKQACTLHSLLYIPVELKNGKIRFEYRPNLTTKEMVYFVDEASMISNIPQQSLKFVNPNSILKDLINYVKEGNEKNKIVFLGDRFQLPPVKEDFSPALSSTFLKEHFNLSTLYYELTTVMRQKEGGNILHLATTIKDCMHKEKIPEKLPINYAPHWNAAMQYYMQVYQKENIAHSIIICLSNKDVTFFNMQVRKNLKIDSKRLVVGDRVMNQSTGNYDNHLISSGQFGTIKTLEEPIEHMMDCDFVDSEVSFLSPEGEEQIISCKILLDSLETDQGGMEYEKEKKLLAYRYKENKKFGESKKASDDPYANALRLRHGYAITCHKAQGGEWDEVMVHPTGLKKDLRWAYTAITRARKRVYSFIDHWS